MLFYELLQWFVLKFISSGQDPGLPSLPPLPPFFFFFISEECPIKCVVESWQLVPTHSCPHTRYQTSRCLGVIWAVGVRLVVMLAQRVIVPGCVEGVVRDYAVTSGTWQVLWQPCMTAMMGSPSPTSSGVALWADKGQVSPAERRRQETEDKKSRYCTVKCWFFVTFPV